MLLESTHLKPGKKLWVNSIYGMDLPGCRMDAGAPIYGTVTEASSARNPNSSALSIAFQSADCVGHAKQLMKLALFGVFAPRGEQPRGHNAVPTELQGSSRQISDTAASTDGYDADLGAAFPSGVKPGTVMGFRNIRLEPQGGPRCSARLTSNDSEIVFPPGTILLLAPRTEE